MPQSDRFAPARQTTHEWVRARMRAAILSGEYAPGTRIVQTEIAERYGVSVTPVREAMRDLVGEGLIRLDPHKAATVREVDVAQALEINDLRLILEPLAVRRAALVIPEQAVDELDAIQLELDTDPDDEAWVDLNHRWHMLVMEEARSPQLMEILVNLREISRFSLAATLRTSGVDRGKSNRDHRDMAAAFRRRDAEAAAAIMAAHLPRTEDLEARFAALGAAAERTPAELTPAG